MKWLKAMVARLEPKAQALDRIRRIAGCRRYVYNRLLAEREAALKSLGDAPAEEAKKAFNRGWSYEGMARRITGWRHETEWLDACPVHALQNGAKDLMQAYVNWWEGRAERPRFKKKSSGRDSWRESDRACFEVNGQAVKLPKIGWVRARIPRKIGGRVNQITVKRIGEHWHASLLVEEEVRVPEPNGGSPLGLDRGIAQDVTDSNGKVHDLRTATREEKVKLRRLARSISRKKKGSRNREKAKKRLSRAKGKIDRRVLHDIHVLTFRTAKNHGLVAIEDLGIRGMTASAAGTVEEPGKNVAQKRGLNRAILETRWGEMGRQWGYKCPWYGSRLAEVEARYSSQECSECGHVASENRLTRDLFRCVKCGHTENADINAAKVIRKRGIEWAAGHAVTACGEDVRPRVGRRTSKKQEPTRSESKDVA